MANAGPYDAIVIGAGPNGCTVDMTDRIERAVERFAPGFRDRILARHVMAPADLERHNPNLIGGDIGGGSQQLARLFTRPIIRLNPHSTPVRGLYLCSSSTPPSGGVHGMCGYFAARSALRREFLYLKQLREKRRAAFAAGLPFATVETAGENRANVPASRIGGRMLA